MQPVLPRLWLLVSALTLSAGCASQTAAPAPPPGTADTDQITVADPCANRLHDMCGALLLYYFTHHQLPGRLDDLVAMQTFGQELGLTCPVSGLPYVYNRAGIVDIERNSRVIIYDPQPSHAGTRRAISIVEPRGNEALVAKVVALPESFFLLQSPPK